MVFDEVDAGIGGAIAEIVGRELRALGARGQVLCVTHLPQVASQAHHHLRVTKLTDGRTTRTTLTELTADDRVEELARMLGGVEVTAKAREHARDMLAAASGAPTRGGRQRRGHGAPATSAERPAPLARGGVRLSCSCCGGAGSSGGGSGRRGSASGRGWRSRACRPPRSGAPRCRRP